MLDTYWRNICEYLVVVRQIFVDMWLILHTTRCDRDSLPHVLATWRKSCENSAGISVRLVNEFCIKFNVFSWSTGKNDAETCALLVTYATYSGTSLPTLQDNFSIPFSGVSFLFGFLTLEDETHIDCPETSVHNYHYTLRNFPEERRSHVLRGENLKSLKSNTVHVMNA